MFTFRSLPSRLYPTETSGVRLQYAIRKFLLYPTETPPLK